MATEVNQALAATPRAVRRGRRAGPAGHRPGRGRPRAVRPAAGHPGAAAQGPPTPGCRPSPSGPCSPSSARAGSTRPASSCSPPWPPASGSGRGLPGLLAALAAMAAFTAADKAGQLEQLESELFGLATLVEREHRVRSALTNPGLPVENKRALVADLLSGPAGAPPPWPTCWSSCTRATTWTPWPGSGRRRRRPAATGWWPRCAAPSSSTTSAGPAGRGPDPGDRQAGRPPGHGRRDYFGLGGRPRRGRAVRRQHPQPPRAGPRGLA